MQSRMVVARLALGVLYAFCCSDNGANPVDGGARDGNSAPDIGADER